MTGALIILLVTVCVGIVLYVYDLKYKKTHSDKGGGAEKESVVDDDAHGEICCGRHLVCEKSLSPKIGEEIVYYDDEELDKYAGKKSDEYTEGEIDEVREVMVTLLPEDVAGWVRSIQLRGINLPDELKDELFILLQ